MSDTPAPRAAGCFIAGAVIAGALLGVYLGQPSIGVIAGAGSGIALALVLWLFDRRRR